MEIRLGFTLVSGSQGWQLPPIQFLKLYKTAENISMDNLKTDLQDIMDYAEKKLRPYVEVSKDDALIQALNSFSEQAKKLTKE